MADLTIMVAPNGARKGHAEHHNLPLTAEAIAADALACKTAGAQAVHMHVRDADGRHTLDASRYLAATEAVRRLVGRNSLSRSQPRQSACSGPMSRSRWFGPFVPRL